jgi:NAD(P)-dependent dehydrogenase (short-subunit alcohol dehydrogenase family)
VGRLEGKIAVVTGTTSGIGQATAYLFAREGASVVMAARRADRGEAMVKELVAEGREAFFVHTDITRTEDCRNLIEKAVQHYGRVDILVNVSGINLTYPYFEHEFDEADREKMFRTNVYGMMDTCKAVIPHMLKQGKGSIVNVASVAGLVACPMDCVYSATKGAVKQLTISMAADYAQTGVRVNGVCPGLTRTEMVPDADGSFQERVLSHIPQHRVADPKEIAYGILFMASDEASFCTGSMLVIDGGESIA